MNYKDTYRHKGQRRKLMETIRAKGIQDEKVLTAINSLPRHFFMEKGFEEWAYIDKAFPIGSDQTISQPYTVAFQTELLQIKKRDKILEVGTGSGYQASILALLGARVHTIERQEDLYHKTNILLEKLDVGNIRTYFRDGYKGIPEFAPFDKMIITAGAKSVPTTLKNQLKIGGILVIPIGDDNTQKMFRITRVSEKEFKKEEFANFRFVPFLKGTNKK
ncbi:MAG: protein-L-isoaspartate(D-aspartate) O-methyltransferase [Saprospiraceae bacterium]|nr:protein-L-isoaspartate(D-aspartate) O-methyltransferase [Saprospiraceae bacterium]MDB4539401.1 protein-L-isoaspartate(D-aspartate) O-methyltransferase [Saprospiraceae bacterium]MDC3210568.1 protein-L-isoaspartate(D-aspartate) O-methyltransferase [Saprospiraceae bacterium]MDG1434557.1 protein-L-isoaspartate(D-aspartate) O-methyltransferase [Saprospiraceae bacterium]MDG2418726.1 protein-L-isoaspartate(D-aspartate) O-methyltransferase [Saprospiraceae bacterium]